jgi:hypothetical protein
MKRIYRVGEVFKDPRHWPFIPVELGSATFLPHGILFTFLSVHTCSAVQKFSTPSWSGFLWRHHCIGKTEAWAGYRCLTPVILATQEAEIRRIAVWSQRRQIVRVTLCRKYPLQKGLVMWLKVKALNSSPGTAKKERLKHGEPGRNASG